MEQEKSSYTKRLSLGILSTLLMSLGCANPNSTTQGSMHLNQVTSSDRARQAITEVQNQILHSDHALAHFETAFDKQDQAKFVESNIPVHDSAGRFLSHEKETTHRRVSSVLGGVAAVEDEETSLFYTEGEYEKDLRQLFDPEFRFKQIARLARYNSVLHIDLLEFAEETILDDKKAYRLKFSIQGMLDGKAIHWNETLVYSDMLPFIANPVIAILEDRNEGDHKPRTRILSELNGESTGVDAI